MAYRSRTRRLLFGTFLILISTLWCFGPVGAQSLAPLTQTLSIDSDSMGITISYPDDWSVAPKRFTNMVELINVPADQQNVSPITAGVKVRTQSRTDHTEAVGELKEIAAEVSSPSTFLSIGGWPGLQRRSMERRQQPSKGPMNPDEWVLKITTAVAAGNILVRLDASLPSDAPQELIDEAEAIGRSLTFTVPGDPAEVQKDLEDLRSTSGRSGSLFPPTLSGGSSVALSSPLLGGAEASGGSPGAAQRLFTLNNGELEISVSPDAQTVVVARQNNWRASNDGGQTFPFSGNINLGDGDPSLAYGQSGNFYLAGISINCLPADATGPFGYDCTGILRSTNNGQTFPFLSNAVRCPKDDPNAPPNPHLATRCFPDQEHIAADRVNAAPGGGDQVYSVWRNFDATDQDPAIVCSQDNGVNWTAPVDVDSGFIPRVGVGQDGFVYVVYRSGGNIRINKYSSCANGLTVQPTFPKTIASVNDVTCPVPGIDRCNDGNNLSSIMVAVDDTNANHVYVAYAHETAAGNQNILVRDSTDGGVTWSGPRVVTINASVSGVRFMPWVCTTGGDAFVTWYDRRAATPCATPPCAANNDLTDYYAGSAGLDGGGNLVARSEFKITDAPDPECASGWPCAPRATGDSESCSVQPQLAGVCCGAPTPTNSCPGSNNRCDFSTPTACLTGETCTLGGGCPKYGDYNGNACMAGRLFTGWASATPPTGIAASGGIDVFFSAFKVLAPTANPGGPYTTNEGTSITLNGSGSTDPRGQALTYEWDFDNDGTFNEATGPTPVFDIVGRSGFFTIALRVTDTSGFSDIAKTTVTVNNLPPVAKIDSVTPAQPVPGQPVELKGSFTDPSWLDLHTAQVLWGDGKVSNPPVTDTTNTPPASTGKVDATHTYCAPGVYTATLEIKDDSGVAGTDTGTDTKTITVDLGPDSPGVIKTDNYLTFLTWTHTVPGTLGSANFQWRNGAGNAAMWWIYRNLTGDWLFFFVMTTNENSTFNPGKPASSRNFLAIAVPTIEFKRWFWCGIALYDQYGRFTGYGCHPDYGPANPVVLHPWVQKRIVDSLPHVLKLLSNTFGGSCP